MALEYNPLGGGGNDADAQAFITAASITDSTQQSAINTLVTQLKGYGIWTKMKALYPFVGGNASAHKFNLKDPRDLDAAYRLVFNGGWTHSSNGALPNGTNAYADTKLNPRTALSIGSSHISKYNRNNDLTGSSKTDGCYDGSGPLFFQQNYVSANGAIGDINNVVSYTQTDTRGLFITTRTSSNILKVFKNTTQQGSTNTTTIPNNPNTFIYIGARSYNNSLVDSYNIYESAFASIGDGLSDAEAANFYTAVQTFQSTLGRNV